MANHKKINVFFGRKYFFGVLFNRCLIENWGNHILPGSIQRKENWMKDRKVPNGRGKSSCSGYWNVQTCRRSRWRSSWATGNKHVFYSTPSTEGVESTRGNSVCLCVCLSVITFSFYKYSIIWWSRPCKPCIFWKFVMLATSAILFWPSNTEYQPVPPSSDQVFNDLMV